MCVRESRIPRGLSRIDSGWKSLRLDLNDYLRIYLLIPESVAAAAAALFLLSFYCISFNSIFSLPALVYALAHTHTRRYAYRYKLVDFSSFVNRNSTSSSANNK